MKLKIFLAAGAAAIMTTTAAEAQTITYTFAGDFAGTIDGVDFSSAGVFTGIGDVATFSMPGPSKFVNLSSLTATLNGQTLNASTTTQFFLNTNNFAGLFFGSAGNGGGSFAATGPGLVGYDAVSALPTTALTTYGVGPVTIFTDRGTVQLSSFGNGTFTAALAGAVPEPATWAMMIAGFGMVGGSLRRRAKVSVSYA